MLGRGLRGGTLERSSIHSKAVSGSHWIEDVATGPVIWSARIRHQDYEPLFRSNIGADIESGGRLTFNFPPAIFRRVVCPHVREVAPIVTASDNDPTCLGVVHREVPRAWLRPADR